MQHSTHNHTPTHHDHHHTHPHHRPKAGDTRDALDGPGQEQPENNTHTQVSPQDPTACRTRNHPEGQPRISKIYSELCSTQPPPQHRPESRHHKQWIS